jgi:ATP-dependent metalloprotease
MEHETLDSDEVRKVIKGEPIRNIVEVLKEEVKNVEREDNVAAKVDEVRA